jgi:DNA repair protein SbcD/Mre11
MRFLHTSDWHLGRSLHRADLRDAQASFLDHLVETARAEQVDAVLVAGDVYDRAIPPVDAVSLYEDAIARLRATGARVILISGNHDSARRLGVNSTLIDAAGVHLRTRPAGLADPVLLSDDYGQVAVYGIPYLEPALANIALADTSLADTSLADTSLADTALADTALADTALADTAPQNATQRERSHAAVLGEAVARIRAHAAVAGLRRSVVLAHAWVVGGADDGERKQDAARGRSDSERDISVGGIGYVPASLFDGFSYAALGHLHGRQTLAEHIRYSGSPLPYSFSEKDHKKGSWLVEVGLDGKSRAEWVAAPAYKRLSAVAGPIDDLLRDARYAEQENDFIAATITDAARPEGAMDKLRARFPHILTLAFEPEGVTVDPRSYRERVRGRDDLAVAAEFVRHVRNTAATDTERGLLQAAFAAARAAGDRGDH